MGESGGDRPQDQAGVEARDINTPQGLCAGRFTGWRCLAREREHGGKKHTDR